MDPGNTEAQEIEGKITEMQKSIEEAQSLLVQRSQQGEAWRREEVERQRNAEESRESLKAETIGTYRNMLKHAWVDGQPTKEERAVLDVVRLSLGIPDTEHSLVEREVQLEVYAEALRAAWRSGVITTHDRTTHENLRQLFGVSKDDHLVIETDIIREVNRDGKETKPGSAA